MRHPARPAAPAGNGRTLEGTDVVPPGACKTARRRTPPPALSGAARLHDGALQAAHNLMVELVAALGPLESLRAGPHPFAELVERHSQIVAALSDDGSSAAAAFTGQGGQALAG